MIDSGTVAGIATALLLLAFSAVAAWAWSPARRERFERAARLPFSDDQEGTP